MYKVSDFDGGCGHGPSNSGWSAGPRTWTTAGSRSSPRDLVRPSRHCSMPWTAQVRLGGYGR